MRHRQPGEAHVGDRLLRVGRDGAVDVAIKYRCLQHGQPGRLVGIDHVVEAEGIRRLPDAHGLGRHDVARLLLEVAVVRQIRARGQDQVLGKALELGLVGELPLNELGGDLGVLRALGNGDDVTTHKARGLPLFQPR